VKAGRLHLAEVVQEDRRFVVVLEGGESNLDPAGVSHHVLLRAPCVNQPIFPDECALEVVGRQNSCAPKAATIATHNSSDATAAAPTITRLNSRRHTSGN
jgi:hypothetical protein